MRLQGKVAVITGAGAGIGRATALMFGAEGASVVAADRDAGSGQRTADDIIAAGGKAHFICADVSRATEVKRMFESAAERFGGIDIIFNNAGIVKQGRIEDSSEEDWHEQVETTLSSVVYGCMYGIPYLRKRGGGVIVNMSSVAAVKGIPNRAIYSTAKGGVAALTRAVAIDHAAEQIRVVSLTPATIETPSLTDRINSSPDPAEARRMFEARQPIGRLGTPNDVAYAVVYAASDEASFLTGCEIAVDGGMGA